MATSYGTFFKRLQRLFRSGPALRRKIKGQEDYQFHDKQIGQYNYGTGAFPFKREQNSFNILGGYGLLDRLNRYQEYEEMEMTSEVATALNVFADEICSGDDKGKSFHIYSDNPDIKRSLEELFYDVVNVEFELRAWARNICKYGDLFIFVEVVPNLGVVNVHPLPVNEVEREEGFDKNDPYSVRFKWMGRGQKLLDNWQILHFRLLGKDLYAPYGSCIEKHSKVLTNTGIKEIQNIEIGDEVISFDIETQQKISSKVLDKVNSGQKECYRLSTRHNFIEASKEHRILYYDKEKKQFDYKNTLDFNIGDCLVINKEHHTDKKTKINKSKPENHHNGFWDEIENIPDYINEDIAELFGFLIGDGWITYGKSGSVYFALGVENNINKKYIDLLEKYLNKKVKFYFPYYRNNELVYSTCAIHSKTLALILKRIGFNGNAYTKRLPNWVFSSNKEIKEAVLQGLFNADGSMFTDKWNCTRYTFELANEHLIKDIKTLVQSLGYKSGKILSRKRIPGIINGIKAKNIQQVFCFNYYKSKNEQVKKHNNENRISDEYIIEPIISIEEVGLKETYDIFVGNENHNFYANGIVVHNSMIDAARRPHRQLMLMEDSMLTYRVVRSSERRVFYIDITNIPPLEVPQYMEAVKTTLKSNTAVDRTGGRLDYRYNTPALDDDFYIPRRGAGDGTRIETLAAGQNVTATQDVEYLQKKLTAALMVPRDYLGWESSLGSRTSLSNLDVRFSRTINAIQKTIIAELNKLAILHLYSKGYDGEDLIDFELRLSNPSTVAMQQKLQLWKTRFEIADQAKSTELVDTDFIFKEILGLNEDEIKKINRGLEKDKLRSLALDDLSLPQEGPPSVQDTFDPTNYQVPGINNKNNNNFLSPEEEKKLLLEPDELNISLYGRNTNNNSNSLPIKPSPYIQNRRNQISRQVSDGPNATAIPDTLRASKLSTTQSLRDLYDNDLMSNSLSESLEDEIESLKYTKCKTLITSEIKKMLETYKTHQETLKNYSTSKPKVILTEELSDDSQNNDDEEENDIDLKEFGLTQK